MMKILLDALPGYGVLALAQAVVFAISVMMERTGKVPREVNRKFVHVCGAGTLLMVPVLFESHWAVLMLAIAFVMVLLATTLLESFRGLHGVGRGVGGVVTYPLAGWMLYYGAFEKLDNDWLAYVIPVLVLATADAMGALVGTRWGKRRYLVSGSQFRSVEGSAVVAIVSFVCSFPTILLLGGNGFSVAAAALISVYLAVAAASLESISTNGLDNVLVPLGVMVVFNAVRSDSVESLLLQLAGMVFAAGMATLAIGRRAGNAGGPTVAAIMLFVVLTAGGLQWVLPFFAFIFVYMVYDRLAPESRRQRRARGSLATVSIALGGPTIILAGWSLVGDPVIRDVLFLTYVATLGCTAGIMWLTMPNLQSFPLGREEEHTVAGDRYSLTPQAVVYSLLACLLIVSAASGGFGETPGDSLAGVVAGTVAALSGVLVYVAFATRVSACCRCPKCGGRVLLGLGCCEGDAPVYEVGSRSLNFHRTLALSNGAAAGIAVVVLAGLGG